MKKRILYLLTFILLLGTFASCSFFEKRNKKNDIVVSISNEYLTKSDLELIVPAGTDSADSISIVNAYIQRWATDVLLYEHAKNNLSNHKEINDMVEEYRRRLMIHFYEQNMIQERVTVPTDAQAAIYYHRHIEDFLLQESVMKGVVLYLPNDAAKADRIKKQMHKPLENIEKIEKYALQYATDYKIFLNDWLYQSTLCAMTPLMENIKGAGYFEQSDSTGMAICYITEFTPKGEAIPESIVLDQARTLLYRENQMNFLQNFGEEIYQYGINHNEIKFYNDEK